MPCTEDEADPGTPVVFGKAGKAGKELESRGLISESTERAWVLPATCSMLLLAVLAFAGGMATSWVLLKPKPAFLQTSSAAGSAGSAGSADATSPAPASYGFVYTEEGTQILETLRQKAKATGDARDALSHAQGLLRSNRHFLDACHPLLHRFGRSLYFDAGKEGLANVLGSLVSFNQSTRQKAAALVSQQDSGGIDPAGPLVPDKDVELLMVCNAAFLHGGIELFLQDAGLQGNLEAGSRFVARHICQRLAQNGARPAWECFHGLGHGVVQFHRSQHTRRALKESLNAAGVLPTHKSTIWNGIWMDHFASTTVSGNDGEDAKGAMSVCSDVDAGNHFGEGDCHLYAPTSFLLHRPRAYVEALTWCYEGCEDQHSCLTGCVHGVGMQTFKENLDDLRLVQKVCKAAKANLQSSCMLGAMGYYRFAFGTSVPKDLCAKMQRDELKRICLR